MLQLPWACMTFENCDMIQTALNITIKKIDKFSIKYMNSIATDIVFIDVIVFGDAHLVYKHIARNTNYSLYDPSLFSICIKHMKVLSQYNTHFHLP